MKKAFKGAAVVVALIALYFVVSIVVYNVLMFSFAYLTGIQ